MIRLDGQQQQQQPGTWEHGESEKRASVGLAAIHDGFLCAFK